MKSLIAIAATLLLAGTSTYSADVKLQDTKLGKTVHGPDLTFNDMKGQVVLITHWGAHCGTCVALLPEWQALYKKYNDQGLHVVGLEMDKLTDSEVDNLCRAKHVGFQVAVGGILMKDGHANWPHTFLFGPDGKLIADNAEGKALETKIKDALAEANSFDAGYGPYTKLAPLAAQVKAGQGLGQVLKALTLKKSGKDAAEASEAAMMFDAVNNRAEELLNQALAAKDAKPLTAITRLDKLTQQFDGCDLGKKAKQESEKLKNDPAVRKEVESAGLYAQLQTLCDSMKSVQGVSDPKSESYRRVNAQTIQSLLAGCQTLVQRYPGTKAAVQAEQLMGEYR
jgi:thiol-disulfide isomerase/thioredoxin